MLTTIAKSLDLLALSYAMGATIWFFFVQSPVLVKRMGRDKFVPLQMSLVGVLFKSISVALFLMLISSLMIANDPTSWLVVSAAVGLVGAALNAFFAVPRALKMGGRSMREELTADEKHSAGRFASDGGGEATRVWHRIVVLFVVVMLAGLAAHAVLVVSAFG